MAVYVDPIFVWESSDPQAKRVGSRTGHQWCHMWSDAHTVDELHKIAAAIGMKRAWFQNKKHFPHYDLVPTKRALALKHGAIEMSLRTWLRDGYQLLF